MKLFLKIIYFGMVLCSMQKTSAMMKPMEEESKEPDKQNSNSIPQESSGSICSGIAKCCVRFCYSCCCPNMNNEEEQKIVKKDQKK